MSGLMTSTSGGASECSASVDFSHSVRLAAYVATIANGFDTSQLHVYFDQDLCTDVVERIVQHPVSRPVTLRK